MEEKKERSLLLSDRVALAAIYNFRQNEGFDDENGLQANTLDRSSFAAIDKTLSESSLLSKDLFQIFTEQFKLPNDGEVPKLLEQGRKKGIGEEELEKICARILSLHIINKEPSFLEEEKLRLFRFKAPKPMV